MPRTTKQRPRDFRATLLEDRFAALDWIWEDDSADPLDAESREQIALIQGLMRFAAVDLASMLLDDIRALARGPLSTETRLLDVLGGIPVGVIGSDRMLFACRFHAALASVTQKITTGWAPPASAAEEVALHLILDHSELLADLHQLDIDEDFREQMEGELFDDTDFHAFLNPSSTAHVEFWTPYSTGKTDERQAFARRGPDD